MPIENLFVVTLKEDDEDFLWHCTICGASGKGPDSEAKHVNRSGSHGVKNINRYVPEKRLDQMKAAHADALDVVGKLKEMLPAEGDFVLDDEAFRHAIARFVDSSYFEGDQDVPVSEVTDWMQRLVWNDEFWRGFEIRLVKDDQMYARRMEEFRAEQDGKNEEYRWRRWREGPII